MQFTHKLARRLALSRAVRVAALLAVASACDSQTGGDLGPVDEPHALTVLTRVVLDHRLLGVEVNQKMHLTAEGRSPTGERAPGEVEWSATGGTIDFGGTFSAAVPGSHMACARARPNEH